MSKFNTLKNEIQFGISQYVNQCASHESNPLLPLGTLRTIVRTASDTVDTKIPELNENEKECVLNCIRFQIKHFECEKARLEREYDAVEHYNQQYEDALNANKSAQQFYTNLLDKIDKIL